MRMPELQPSSSHLERAEERWGQGISMPFHQRPKAPTNQDSLGVDPSRSPRAGAGRWDAVPAGGARDLEVGMTAAMVKKAKLWKACFGVRRATEARLEKWKVEPDSRRSEEDGGRRGVVVAVVVEE